MDDRLQKLTVKNGLVGVFGGYSAGTEIDPRGMIQQEVETRPTTASFTIFRLSD